MSQFWNEGTRRIKPYVPGEQPKAGERVIKINTNENPYPPSPKVLEAIEREKGEGLRLYPDPDAMELVFAICSRFGVKPEQVFVGNGSDEVLAFAFRAFWDRERPVLAPAISYSFYPVYAQLFEIPLVQIPMADGLTVDFAAFVEGNGGVVLANPNAPTSTEISRGDLEKILKAHPADVVLVDEAYVDFGGASAIDLIEVYPNLLVVRTLSKSYSLAGLRIGFAVGSRELIEGLKRVKNSFNSYPLDRIAIAAGAAAIADVDYYNRTIAQIVKTRAWTEQRLRSLDFDVLPSSTNFLFASHGKVPAHEIFMKLKDRGILVRYFRTPGIDQYLRISIGTDMEMQEFVKALEELL